MTGTSQQGSGPAIGLDLESSSVSSFSSWSHSSTSTMTSSSASASVASVHVRNDVVELHELRLLRSIVREIYMDSGDADNGDSGDAKNVDSGDADNGDSGDADNESTPEEPSEVPDTAEGGLRPFIPPLRSTPLPSNSAPDYSEGESSEDEFSTPEARVVAISNSFRSEAAQAMQASLVKELAGVQEYGINRLWPEAVNQPSGEQVTN